MPWYAGKLEIREYLKELNKDEKAGPHQNLPRTHPRADADALAIDPGVHTLSTRPVYELLDKPSQVDQTRPPDRDPH